MKKFLLSLTIICCYVCTAQKQRENDFDFLITSIKNIYAGYEDKVKGNEFDSFTKKIRKTNSKDTFALLSQLTSFFNDQHLLLYDEKIANAKIDTEQCKRDNYRLQRYFASNKKKDKYEGYWMSGFNNCVIALKRVGGSPITYHGYVVETNAKLPLGFCMLKMVLQQDGNYRTEYVDVDFFFRIFIKAKFKSSNTLWVYSFDKFQRIVNYTKGLLSNKEPISYKPTFANIDGKTVLLNMPSFRSNHVKASDSLIKANKSAIENATTLIIDIRNNGGGTITNYLPLLPYVYTGPILHCGSYARYSDVYIQSYQNRIQRLLARGDTIKAIAYKKILDTIIPKKGQYGYNPPDTLAQGLPILDKPRNIAILTNNICVSAAELMLLNFKQSGKTKVFGEVTGGGVDYLDALTIPTPSGRYSLFIAITKRALTLKEPSYDTKGIPPDIEISDDIADWVAFVKKFYDERK